MDRDAKVLAEVKYYVDLELGKALNVETEESEKEFVAGFIHAMKYVQAMIRLEEECADSEEQ